MSADIGPGDFVECVDVSAITGPVSHLLTLGAVYQVTEIGVIPPEWAFEGTLTLKLREVPYPEGYGYFGFCINRFRPIYRPKQSLIHSLTHPAKRERETIQSKEKVS